MKAEFKNVYSKGNTVFSSQCWCHSVTAVMSIINISMYGIPCDEDISNGLTQVEHLPVSQLITP